MKTKTSRATTKLSTIMRDTVHHPVTDDLAGLDRLVPEAPSEFEQFALFHAQLPALLELRGRGQVHSEQVQRLIKLLAKEPDLVGTWIDVANAMTVLTNASHLALMLLPARTDDDSWTLGDLGRHLLNRARAHGDQRDIDLARRVVGRLPATPRLNLSREPEAVQDMINAMVRRAAALHPAPDAFHEVGRPGIHVLEQADSLEAFFYAPPDFGELLDRARALLRKIDGLRLHHLPPVREQPAYEGMLILAYAKLLRIALWPARSEGDLAAKIAASDLVRSRDGDADRYRALFEIALGQGETIARQSDRFINLDRAD